MSFIDQTLDVVLRLPGVKVNREEFLRSQLSIHYNPKQVEEAIHGNPSLAGIPQNGIDSIARAVINNHTNLATGASFLAGIPGGFAMFATVPADTAQFFANTSVLSQKLAYLYGWPEIGKENSEEFKNIILLFLGVMMGIGQANKLTMDISRRLAEQVAKRLPNIALTKFPWYNLLVQICKWLGIKLTKEKFAGAIAKAIPILGGFVSGIMTYTSMKGMANRLHRNLSEGKLANMNIADNYEQEFEFEDVNYEDFEFDVN